jgi:phospholipid N-methyltransferase
MRAYGENILFTVRPSRSRRKLIFAQNFLKYPKMIGSLVPSSRFLVERLLQPIDWSRAKVVVEYGPGVGNITREILKRLPRDASLIAIEINRDFVRLVREENDDPRLSVVHASAVDVRSVLTARGHSGADYIISSIPYTTLDRDLRVRILRESRAALKGDGALVMYQFTRAVLPYLRQEFGRVRTAFEPFNVLPAQLFTCEK